MFGRKFQLLKKKIFTVESSEEKQKTVINLIDDEEGDHSVIVNKSISTSDSSVVLSSQSQSNIIEKEHTKKGVQVIKTRLEEQKPKVDLNKIFTEDYRTNNHFLNFNLSSACVSTNPNSFLLLDQTLSKFKTQYINSQSQIQSFSRLRIFQHERDLLEYINRNLKVFYTDRFFIFPLKNLDSLHYKTKYRNATNKITHNNFCCQPNENWKIKDNSKIQEKLIFSEEELQVESVEKFEVIIYDEKQFQIERHKERYHSLIEQLRRCQQELLDQEELEKKLELKKNEIVTGLNYGEIHRKNLNEYIHIIKGNIRVYCRVKPASLSDQSIIRYPEMGLNISQAELISLELKNPKNLNENTIFNFDRVFTEHSTQEDIFSEVKPFIQSALDGENVCIFAYGSTGSGKTHTMQGYYLIKTGETDIITPDSGILPRCAQFIFEEASRLNLLGQKIKVSFSAIEIYNENLYDLLDKSSNNKKSGANVSRPSLTVFLSGNEIQIKNLIWVPINTNQDILRYTKEASDSRRSDSTQFNSCSSRSHAIFQIKIENQNENGMIATSIINIIDLAGSERSSMNSLTGKNKNEIDLVKKIQNEANFINKSLTTLGRIISLIGDKKSGKVAIPYRESKLTMVLQNSLKPNSKTVMIVTVCSDEKTLNMTKDSLKFATNTMLSC